MKGYKEKQQKALTGVWEQYELKPEQLQALKSSLLEMTLDVIQVCERFGLRIALAGGSALGAIRHQGFIPWDDDIDLMMPRADYQKLCEVFPEALGKEYDLIVPQNYKFAKTRFPKIIKKNTICRSLGNVEASEFNGIFLDIFILENVPKNRLLRTVKGAWCNFLMLAGTRAVMYKHNTPLLTGFMSTTEESRRDWNRTMRLGRLFSVIPYGRWFQWTDRAVQYRKETGLLGLPTGRKHYFGEILQEQTYLPFSKGMFEGYEVPLPADCDAYLKNLYGDYMQIPPPEKREKHYIQELKL